MTRERGVAKRSKRLGALGNGQEEQRVWITDNEEPIDQVTLSDLI